MLGTDRLVYLKGATMHRMSERILLMTAALALLLMPVAAIAAGGFDDVEDGNVFNADIQWLADAGVAKGCNPPANTEFCPGDTVTREQIAAFMHRLATTRSVDAGTLSGRSVDDFVVDLRWVSTSHEFSVSPGVEVEAFPVECPLGMKAISGGLFANRPVVMTDSYPLPRGWNVGFIVPDGTSGYVSATAYALCTSGDIDGP